MPVSALLVCREDDSVRVLRRVLDELGIASDVCEDPTIALSVVRQQKYDAVMVDCDDLPGGGGLMRDVRRGTSNRLAIVFALTNGTTVRAAFDLGANFVLEKPIIPDRATRCLRAAHGLMMRERRRYLRQPVNVPALLTLSDGMEVRSTIVDVSEGGVSLRGLDPSLRGSNVRMNFILPQATRPFDVRAEISWIGPDSRAGLRFTMISDVGRNELMRWLGAHAERIDQTVVFAAGPKAMPRHA
jgi:DNA-binding response OmpR family regulator